MKKILFPLLLFLTGLSLRAQDLISEQRAVQLMGSRFELIAIAQDPLLALEAIEAGIAEIHRIEQLISSWDSLSQTSAINQQAGIASVIVDRELFQLIYRAKKVSALTWGAFDISYAAMDNIWKFDGSMKKMPPVDSISKAASKINWQHILLDEKESSVFLKEKGMKIGFGAIGKGYAANRAMMVMKEKNILGGLVNAGGDLIAWGASTNAEGWAIKIADPKNKTQPIAWLNIKDMAIVTSGDYERFFTLDGKRYAHIIDPRTGYPVEGLKSVSVLCPDAELADALATAVFVLGKEEGLRLINQLTGVECLLITDQDQLIPSKNLKLNYF